MYNSLDLDPVPSDPLRRITAFPRDLAYGIVEQLWPAEFLVSRTERTEEWHARGVDYWADQFTSRLKQKWGMSIPRSHLLRVYGFIEFVETKHEDDKQFEVYVPTPKAFQLLEQPRPSSVFISYRRSESSALALLIIARMKEIGLAPFLDMQDLEPGEEWHARLQQEIAARDYCLALISCDTLKSEYVRREIQWALNAEKTLIPVWHGGMDGDVAQDMQVQYPELAAFFAKQAIIVEPETPAGYESAIVQLLNRFGYTP
ncbi:toll/interleukin-1 receptor domain-containing protein [Aggregatilinea lenta]|uniref:toll/interleukin-1 receptor domain-containing protein n=1 Tax=Aggregatilinea lenta TaxID=913108 RepID=UPI000E5BF3E2|nr:toll/interleukin-1 receptor domain-containing protein [Aggregatilinea lenta]